MDILVGNPIISIGLATVLSLLWFSYVNSPARKVRQSDKDVLDANFCVFKLANFPTAGSSLPILSLIDTIKFLKNGRDILNAGVRKASFLNTGFAVMLTTFENWSSGLLVFSNYQPLLVGG